MSPGDASDEDVAAFRSAGRALYSLGLVKGSEGNLSTFDGSFLRITRAGASLAELAEADLVTTSDEGEAAGASSDLQVHRGMYRERGPGAVAHAHPPGAVPEEGGGPGRHGVYVFAASLAEAVGRVVDGARATGHRVGPA